MPGYCWAHVYDTADRGSDGVAKKSRRFEIRFGNELAGTKARPGHLSGLEGGLSMRDIREDLRERVSILGGKSTLCRVNSTTHRAT